MNSATELLLDEHRKTFRSSNSDQTPTVRLVRSSHAINSIPARLLERLSRDGIKPHHPAPDYLLKAAGIPRSLHTAWSARYALAVIQERRHA